MLTALLVSVALGGDLVVDAKVPVEIHINNQPIAQLFHASELRFGLQPGKVDLRLMVSGKPNELVVDIPEEGVNRVVVGRTGITTAILDPVATTEQTHVEFRVTGTEDLTLQLDSTRHRLRVGEVLQLDLDSGVHKLAVTNLQGTVLWSRGTLDLPGKGDVVVHLADGRLPEVSGPGARFSPGQQ